MAASDATNGNVYMHENLGAPQPSQKAAKNFWVSFPASGLWWYAERYLTPLRAKFCKKFTLSAEIRQRMIDLWRYPPAKVEVLYHGVDVARFRPSADTRERLRQSMGIGNQDTVIILAARLSQEKCIDRAIDAFDVLAREIRLSSHHCGNRSLRRTVKNLAAAKTENSKIKFLGHVSNVQELYQMSDIYVLSDDNEGLSLAFLEALAKRSCLCRDQMHRHDRGHTGGC